MKKQIKIQWVAGIVLIFVVVLAVMYVNPGLQKGALGYMMRYSSPKKPKPVSMGTMEIRHDADPTKKPMEPTKLGSLEMRQEMLPMKTVGGNCRTADDFDVQLTVGDPHIQRIQQNPARTVQAVFTITPKNCTLTLQDLAFQWVNKRRQERNYDEVLHINMSQPQAEVRSHATASEFPFSFTGPRLLCMEGMDAGTISLAADTPVTVTPENYVTVEFSSILFDQYNEHSDGIPKGDSEYALRLFGVGNIPKVVNFPTFRFAWNSPVNMYYANFCANPE